MPEWDKVNNDDPAIGYGQTRSPLWSTQLQELGKKNTYRQLIQSPSMDNFQNIIT